MPEHRLRILCESCGGTGLVPAFGEAGELGATECCDKCESHTRETFTGTGRTYARGSGEAENK